MTAHGTIRIATRRSRLALAQAGQIADQLAAVTGRPVQLVPVATAGDDTSGPIDALGTTGVFVAAVRRAVQVGDADLAVHSMKDLPTRPEEGLVIGAVPQRADARDVLCAPNGVTLADLPPGGTVATGSPRRAAQMRDARPDISVVGIRGNVETRLQAAAQGRVDAVVLAAAGLQRLGRSDAISEIFAVDVCTPAPAQGALAVECREGLRDAGLADALASIDDADTRAAVTAERRLLAVLEAGCTAPVGAYAVQSGGEITITAVVAGGTDSTVIRMLDSGPATADGRLGEILAERLLSAGAADLVGGRIS